MELSCTAAALSNASDVCAFARAQCAEVGAGAFGSYVALWHCELGGSVLTLLLLGLWLVVLIFLLGSTADVHLIPQLNYLSALLKLSPDVAGVTLLAFGNGAPDVFTGIAVATQHDADMDFSLLLSDLVGGSIFIMTVVVGSVVWIASTHAPGWRVETLPFWRDLISFFVALTAVAIVAADGTVVLWEAIGFFVLYLTYIGIVLGLPQLLRCVFAAVRLGAASAAPLGPSGRQALLPEGAEGSDARGGAATARVANDEGGGGGGGGGGDGEEAVAVAVAVATEVTAKELAELPVAVAELADDDDGSGGGGGALAPIVLEAVPMPLEEEAVQAVAMRADGAVGRGGAGGADGVATTMGDDEGSVAPLTMRHFSMEDLAPTYASSTTTTTTTSTAATTTTFGMAAFQLQSDDHHHRGGGGGGGGGRGHGHGDDELRRLQRAEWMPSAPPSALWDAEEAAPMSGLDWEPRASVLSKALWCASLPLVVLQWASIPSSDGRWGARRRRWTLATPPLGLLCFLLQVEGDVPAALSARLGAMPVVVLLLPLGAVGTALLWRGTVDAAPPRWLWALVLAGFAMTVVWLNLLASEMVALVEAFGVMLGVSTSLLGLTVIAIGNSVGDLVADSAAARGADARMAMAACFGSPLLMNILGVGSSLSLKLLLTHGAPVASAVSAQCRLAYGFLYLSLLSHLVVFPRGGFSARRPYALYLWALYALFLLLSCLAETGHVDLRFLCPSGLPCPVEE